jgi:hypothetical protein
MHKNNKRLILIELNEINFDLVEKYLATDASAFPSLRKLLAGPRIRTNSESNYEQLEPWIQWASVHTAKTYQEHGVFRLGDIVGTQIPQIFEQIEQAGYKVGVISAMNAENRLKHPAYFIPDPWTQTPADNSWWSQTLVKAISQTVNDNAQARITAKSALRLALGLIRFSRLKHYNKYLLFAIACRRKPWLKAAVLDLLLHDVHWSWFNKKNPDFSALFLNAGAHIQHHYYFNAAPLREELGSKNPTWYISEKNDPLADIYKLYDMIVGEYFSRADTDVVLATGLTQKPYDKVKFYYRLKSHHAFLTSLGIDFKSVIPRMTRDFLVDFETAQQAGDAQAVLRSVCINDDGLRLFGEIDNRGTTLFVTLTYPKEITSSTFFTARDQKVLLMPYVSFVAIKNGMHQSGGFAFFTPGVAGNAPKNGAHVSELGRTILRYFDIESAENHESLT